MRNVARRIERQHPCGDAFEDGLNMPAALLEGDVGGAELTAGCFDLAAARFQFLGHAIERSHQIADLVGRVHLHAVIQTSARDLLRRLRQRRHRAGYQFGKEQRQPGGGKQHQHGEQQQKPHVSAAYQLALLGQFEVLLLAGLNLLLRLEELLRQRHAHQNQPMVAYRRTAQNVFSVGWLPGKERGALVGERQRRQRILQQGPGRGAPKLASASPSRMATAKPPCKVGS